MDVDSKMKILLVSHSPDLVGAERSLLSLAQELVERGHQVSVAVPEDGQLSSQLLLAYPGVVRVINIQTHSWMGPRQFGIIGLARLGQCAMDLVEYLRLLRRSQFDLVVVNTGVTPAPLLSAKIAHVPVVTIVRESLQTNPSLRSFLPRRLIRALIARWSTSVVCVSEYIRQQFGHASVVRYPQLSTHFLKQLETAESGNAGSSELRAVIIGTVNQEKGQLDAVAAVVNARETGASVRLDIYGPASDRQRICLHSEIERLGAQDYVQYHGEIPETFSVFLESDISLVCSKNEAFGKVTVESILVGTPVVAYARGGTVEILAAGGGCLVEPTVAALTSAIVDACRDRELIQRWRIECAHHPMREPITVSAQTVVDDFEHLYSNRVLR
ncbi:glycosyltransferase [Cryobacterium frigoriphilum]|nr:glycosyltransferase [Cryobacterium frigoriphilum]